MLISSQRALTQRRIAKGAERRANASAATDYPWTTRDVHSWQAVMATAMAKRSRILCTYLERRAAR